MNKFNILICLSTFGIGLAALPGNLLREAVEWQIELVETSGEKQGQTAENEEIELWISSFTLENVPVTLENIPTDDSEKLPTFYLQGSNTPPPESLRLYFWFYLKTFPFAIYPSSTAQTVSSGMRFFKS